MSTKYKQKNSDFAAAWNDPLSADFRPRFHFLYTQRQAEQDAYWWFMKGQESILNQRMPEHLKPTIERLKSSIRNR